AALLVALPDRGRGVARRGAGRVRRLVCAVADDDRGAKGVPPGSRERSRETTGAVATVGGGSPNASSRPLAADRAGRLRRLADRTDPGRHSRDRTPRRIADRPVAPNVLARVRRM
ncbi:MAG: hypothetical protein AVDCRST_MAG87-2015, partial [uncultured Thermomicrobiales bacterium]